MGMKKSIESLGARADAMAAAVKARQEASLTQAQRDRRADPAGKAISEVGGQTAAGLACPKCGGAQFKAKRSAAGKLAGGLLAPKSRVKCVACGTEYRRG